VTKERDLRALSEAALQVENALELRDKLMRQYHAEGYSLRDIANAVAMSHEKVRQIVSR
jgi:transposase